MSWVDINVLAKQVAAALQPSFQSTWTPGPWGKGNGKQGRKGEGGNKETKHGGKGGNEEMPKHPCKCCGRNNHTKKDCYRKDKTCDCCGRTGRLKGICRELKGGAVDQVSSGGGGPGAACTNNKKLPSLPRHLPKTSGFATDASSHVEIRSS